MKFVLHGGFHKTATTHIQHTLEANPRFLADAGVVVPSHSDLRKKFTKVAENQTYQDLGSDTAEGYTPEGGQAKIKEFLDDLGIENARRLVFSEENIVGHVGQVSNMGDMYRTPQKFVEKFAAQLPQHPTDILLAVRSYDTFYSACYMEFLASVSHQRFIPPEVVAAKIFGNMPNWSRLTNIFQDVFPKSRIVVWRYEDFGALYSQIFAELLGQDVAADYLASLTADPQSQQHRKSPGKVTMDEFFAFAKRAGIEQALAQWKDIKDANAAKETGEKYSIWDATQAAHLRRLYDRDWAKLVQDDGLTILVP